MIVPFLQMASYINNTTGTVSRPREQQLNTKCGTRYILSRTAALYHICIFRTSDYYCFCKDRFAHHTYPDSPQAIYAGRMDEVSPGQALRADTDDARQQAICDHKICGGTSCLTLSRIGHAFEARCNTLELTASDCFDNKTYAVDLWKHTRRGEGVTPGAKICGVLTRQHRWQARTESALVELLEEQRLLQPLPWRRFFVASCLLLANAGTAVLMRSLSQLLHIQQPYRRHPRRLRAEIRCIWGQEEGEGGDVVQKLCWGWAVRLLGLPGVTPCASAWLR